MSQSVRYGITHITRYRYSEPVAICQNQVRMLPRDFVFSHRRVLCHDSQARVRPEPDQLIEHIDYFGNRVLSFSIESVHDELEVSIRSEVSVDYSELDITDKGIPWEMVRDRVNNRSNPDWFETQEYQYDSPRITRSSVFANYARPSFVPGRAVVDSALELTERIHRDFNYDTTATEVATSTEEAFELKAGVCQDFAHVQIACLRSLGLPARYVSGYLRTVPAPGEERLVGADESHAWISLYCGESLGWIDLDPTNACLSDLHHVPICIGRDYSEVSPMRGVVLGGGNTLLNVSVDVEPLDGQPADRSGDGS